MSEKSAQRYRNRRLGLGMKLRQAAVYRFHALRLKVDRMIGRPRPHYGLALCLCFRDAASYLEEWLEFHRLVGVEHFYLYNNDSQDDFRSILFPYVEQGLVTLHDWPGKAQQRPVYHHCLRTHGPEARWIGFLDDDEFLFPLGDAGIMEVLGDYESYAGLKISSLRFGASHHKQRPSGIVIENYLMCSAKLDGQGKNIVRPERIWGFFSSELPIARRPYRVVHEDRSVCDRTFSLNPVVHRLRINHYESKSEEEYRKKNARGSAMRGVVHRIGPGTKRYQRLREANACENRDILRFLPLLREALDRGKSAAPPLAGNPSRERRVIEKTQSPDHSEFKRNKNE